MALPRPLPWLAAGAALTALLVAAPCQAQSIDHSRDDPDAFAQGWRRTAYEPTQPRPELVEARPNRDFVGELLGPVEQGVRRMPRDQPRPAARRRPDLGPDLRPGPSADAAPELTAARTPAGQDPALIFE
jgi:hypothetical protein